MHTIDHSTAARAGGICGLLALASYFAAAFVPLPDRASYVLAFAMPVLLIVGFLGLHRKLTATRPSFATDVAAVFAACAGATLLAMLCVQQALFVSLESASDAASKPIRAALHTTHLGLDVAWDVFVSIAVALFAVAMMRHAAFGRVLGGVGLVLALLLLGFNLAYFPEPPGSAESIDWGPAVALWMIVTFAMLWRSARRD